MSQTQNRFSLHRSVSKKESPARTACATRRLLALLLALFTLPTVVQAQFLFTTNNGTIIITGYTGLDGTVVIPNTINGFPVTRIGDYAFLGRGIVTSVTIPNSVTSIGNLAFHNCSSLTNVTIPNSVTNIGHSAFQSCTLLTSVTIPNSLTRIRHDTFYSCTSLASVTIPSSVTNIEDSVFSQCSSLSAITVDALNSNYSSLGGVLFNKSQTLLILCPEGKFGTYTIPNSVTSIGRDAFYFCTRLSQVTIPNSVTTIGNDAFFFCIGLTTVTIPDSVLSIGNSAFFACNSLTSITIPNSVTNIGAYAFYSCASLSAITVAALNSSYSSLGGVLFNKSQTLLIQHPAGKSGSYTIPNSVTSIGEAAFVACTNLTSVTIPNSVAIVGTSAFNACTRLTTVTIPNSVTSIGGYAFYSCTRLTSVMIANSVTNIGFAAFGDCTSLTGIYFLGNAPIVGSSVFFRADAATVYYLHGTAGWGTTFAGRPAVLWNPRVKSGDPSFGVQTNRFGFAMLGASNLVIVVEASTNLANPTWIPVGTNTLTGGSSYFSDPQWTNLPVRFYRLRSP